MLKWLSLSLLVLGLIAPSYAQAPRIDRIEIIDWGVYQATFMSKGAAPGSATGYYNRVKDVRLHHVTTTIQALVGVRFGFRYRIVGSPNGAMVTLKLVTRFPNQGLRNPAKSEVFLTQERHSNQLVGSVSWRGFLFDYDWEVELGLWTLEIWHGDRKLAEKTFHVTQLISAAPKSIQVR